MLKIAAALASLFLLAAVPSPQPATTPSEAPAYTTTGNLIAPTNYREWIFLTSGVDMSYASTADPGHHMFDNVFVNPASYRAFLATGTWPDQTTFILEIRGADSPISINKRGHTQSTAVMGHEIHVKDHGQWRFYDLPAGATEAKLIPPPATCYTCHESHGAVATTFVQFYPTLLPIAEQKHTLSHEYLKDPATK
ncbi:cytochrome P460 [Granulicella sp. 5B5]|uniref:cytochrome P460 family protein n=1 Tax=Granulicella sp. 5B5 TaxID=1617967 RepID=UPI0015F4B7C6|nr:cytochrome P460 family protein [Granulicella sp. 5B5]QMV17761.1 cytochrome P460 [Granulicella sp. 5B5]